MSAKPNTIMFNGPCPMCGLAQSQHGKPCTFHSVQWIPTANCEPPHRVAREDQVIDLANAFYKEGWDTERAALVGYPLGDKIQLLSGSHRYAAAVKAGLVVIPVVVVEFEEVKRRWGTDEWARLMELGSFAIPFIDWLINSENENGD